MLSMEQKAKYRLTYLKGVRGREEMMILMFKLAKVDYEHITFSFEDWPATKSTIPLGQVPVLEEEGRTETVAQTVPIAMYLAEQLGFLPEEKWKQFLTNSIVTTTNDLVTTFGWKLYIYTVYKFFPLPSEEKLAEARQECVTSARLALDYIEKLADKSTKFIFGDQIQLADLALYTELEYCCVDHPELRDHSDWLKRWLKNFESDPRIAEYLQTRPASTYGT